MKPLEALETITALNKPVDESIYNEAINVLRQSLTPPTADEVCEEMEEYFYRCVGKSNPIIEYEKDTKKFVYVTETARYEVVGIDSHNYVNFITSLPAFLILIIARFYEAQE